ncbi:MAG TPA: tyrosine-protein phosphatase [Acidimicrobiia bacterium]|nr:tyrosine-protein phosphatase [Acidimicrobiia bacterium]
MSDPQRLVEFEACFNFRDLGGYPTADGGHVRWGTLYRSDTLHRLTDADAQVFRALGLHTVIDLRSVTEVDDHGRLDPAHGDVAWHHVAMLDNLRLAPRAGDDPAPPVPLPADDVVPGQGYLAIAEQFGTSLARVFELLAADDALPAVFHCTSGKDRTGIVAALMLELLGVDDDVIAADYVLTAESRARSAPWIQANEPQFAAFLRQIPPERRVVSGETILGFLEQARAKYGSGRELLLHLGVRDADLDALRVRLVEH